MNSPTARQLSLIRSMEQLLDVTFTGGTTVEASKFIANHMQTYKEQQEVFFDAVHNEQQY